MTNAHIVAYIKSYITDKNENRKTFPRTNESPSPRNQPRFVEIYCELNVDQILHVSTKNTETTKYEYCLCNVEWEETMIFCENSQFTKKWFHLDCIRKSEHDIPEDFFCSAECKGNTNNFKLSVETKMLPNNLLIEEMNMQGNYYRWV